MLFYVVSFYVIVILIYTYPQSRLFWKVYIKHPFLYWSVFKFNSTTKTFYMLYSYCFDFSSCKTLRASACKDREFRANWKYSIFLLWPNHAIWVIYWGKNSLKLIPLSLLAIFTKFWYWTNKLIFTPKSAEF